MDIETLRLMVDVHRLGSFASAARVQECDPSIVSRKVKEAEDRLNIRLFHRSTRRLTTSEAGEVFIRGAEDLLAEYDRITEVAQGTSETPAGLVRMTTSVAFAQDCVMPLLADFQQALPDITLELVASDQSLDLIRENIDIAIRLAPMVEGDVVCTKLMDTSYGVYVSPDFLDTHNQVSATPSALSEVSVVRFGLPGFRDRWLYSGSDDVVHEVPVSGPLLFSNALCVKDAVLRGFGPGMLAHWMAREAVADGRLLNLYPDIRFTATTFETAAWLIYQNRRHLSAKVRATLDFMRAAFKTGGF